MSESIIEKLGITHGPWFETDIDSWENLLDVGSKNSKEFVAENIKQNNAKVIVAAPEMLKALIETNYILSKLFPIVNTDSERDMMQYHRFHENREIIEKATGKTWAEIKGLIDE